MNITGIAPLSLRLSFPLLVTNHGIDEQTSSSVLKNEVLVGKLVAVDGLAARAVVVGEVTALAHEVRDHPVMKPKSGLS